MTRRTALGGLSLGALIAAAGWDLTLLSPSAATSYVQYQFPLSVGSILSGWGLRGNHPQTFHYGIDFGAPLKTPFKAVADGIVESHGNGVFKTFDYGYWVLVAHDDGMKSFYGHMFQAPSRTSGFIARGEDLGLTGNTGGYQGTPQAVNIGKHLHLGLLDGSSWTNPRQWIEDNAADAANPAAIVAKGLEDNTMMLIYIGDGQGRYGPANATYYTLISDTWRLPISRIDFATDLMYGFGVKARGTGVPANTAFSLSYAEWEAFMGLPVLTKPATIPPQIPAT